MKYTLYEGIPPACNWWWRSQLSDEECFSMEMLYGPLTLFYRTSLPYERWYKGMI